MAAVLTSTTWFVVFGLILLAVPSLPGVQITTQAARYVFSTQILPFFHI
jgi:hypothetical protein